MPVIVTGNGSILNSHLPNGQSLIRRQSSAISNLNGTNGINGTNGVNGTNGINGLNGLNGTNGTLNITNHCISNNNNIDNININGTHNSQTKPTVHFQSQQIPVNAISWNYAIDVWWDKIMAEASSECEPVWVDAEDPLFILYTR